MPSAAAALATAALLVAAAGGAAAQNGGNAMATDSNNHTMTTNLTNVPLPPATSAHNHSAHDHGTGMVRKARAVGRGDRGGACVAARARKQPRSDDASLGERLQAPGDQHRACRRTRGPVRRGVVTRGMPPAAGVCWGRERGRLLPPRGEADTLNFRALLNVGAFIGSNSPTAAGWCRAPASPRTR